MRWKLFATLADAAGDDTVEVVVDHEQPTLRMVLDELLTVHPDLEEHVLSDDGTLQNHVRLLCDGEDPFHDGGGWETDVSGVDEMALFPPVSGG
jgi:molybdopterin synthase sulfur carrier subunit